MPSCHTVIDPPFNTCEKHRKMTMNRYHKTYKQKYRENRQCASCTRPLEPGEAVTCQKCKDRRNSIRKAAIESGICIICKLHPSITKSGLCGNCRILETARTVGAVKTARLVAVLKYGGKCACCGEDDIKFLTIDHINNDGHLTKKKRSSALTALVKGPLREDIRVLCWNCNCGRYINSNICPHLESGANLCWDPTE